MLGVMTQLDKNILKASEELEAQLVSILEVPLYDNSQRMRVSHLASSVALEHGTSCRTLLAVTMVSSALVVHRAQYEATVRAVWALYAASDLHINKLGAPLDVEAEQDAKNIPLVAEMMAGLATKCPTPAYHALANFKENSWRALNSFVHAGIHPLHRQESGYPVKLAEQILRNCNGLAVVARMQAAVLTGRQQFVSQIGALQTTFRQCLPLQ